MRSMPAGVGSAWGIEGFVTSERREAGSGEPSLPDTDQ